MHVTKLVFAVLFILNTSVYRFFISPFPIDYHTNGVGSAYRSIKVRKLEKVCVIKIIYFTYYNMQIY